MGVFAYSLGAFIFVFSDLKRKEDRLCEVDKKAKPLK